LDGQTLWFGGLEEPEFAEGTNVDVVLLDEAQYISHFAESQDVVLRRLRGSGKTERDITCSIVTTSPPPLIPDCRLYDFYENPEKRNVDSKVYRWSMLDNIHLSEKYKQEIIATHHGNLAKRFIDGLFAPVGVGSFEFDSTIHEFSKIDLSIIRTFVYGVDFGWTNPSAIVCVGFDGDGRAYILDEFYQNRTQTETLIQELKEMLAQFGKGRIICDRSSPATIDMLHTAGLNAVADESKRDDGIRELGGRFIVQGDGKPRIYISSKCVNLIHEVMVYNSEIKENDHACFVAGTLISTNRGQVPIENIKETDLVWTRKGLRPVIASGCTGFQEVFKVSFDDDRFLIGTANHPIFVVGKGFVRMDALRYAYKCLLHDPLSCENINVKKEKNKSSTKHYITVIPTANISPLDNISEPTVSMESRITFKETFGNFTTVPFQTGMTFIIKTATLLTTYLKTLSASLKKRIYQTMANSVLKSQKKQTNRKNILTRFDLSRKSGTPQKMGIIGIATTDAKVGGIVNPNCIIARYVGSHLNLEKSLNSVLENVRLKLLEMHIPDTTHWTHVENVQSAGRAKVYNLQVKDASEYYANSVLVHNCDAVRYAVMSVVGQKADVEPAWVFGD
jgi:hypothetical protein